MKRSNALVKVERNTPGFFEREIRAEFECGGHLHLIARGDCVSGVVRQVLASCSAVVLNPNLVFSFKLTYWALDTDLGEQTIQVTARHDDTFCSGRNYHLCHALALKAKRRFLKRLAVAGITLYGHNGSLEKGGAK